MKNNLIEISEEILSGTPVFNETRVPVKTLIDYLNGGETIEDFLDDFPTVTKQQAMLLLQLGQEILLKQTNENIA
ncbi:MAG: DUF433 domain-containing protein [Cyanobacteria bacterium]|nr:DUF433 domain-containing protein [Cyanobacteria bacterium CG_2015-16_32_12]NCO77112.1 DUF433 domain-containing protein [Cyanobacteria bacterium CG_2015-22_32_23]NCQ03945.1 DUF433 domain-containing protein [Cyanobacteria bacterium CG_2015-09_32_10]NCQ42447.1 DUF433 domain-containing protein [Cyanobacteria bacterium CG_2015-04_32_10]NCS85975.1 DUF433 domain-containing protein [Cyanobacteria bacterium CG_2015-02_32_10]